MRGWRPALGLERFLETVRTQPYFLAALMLLNLWGIGYGFYFYRHQLPETPWYFLPLVPDSPLAVIFLSIALLAWRIWGRRWDTFDAFAAAANVKIGAWTVFVLLFHRASYFQPPTANLVTQWLLLVGHAGMVLEAFVLIPRLARSVARSPRSRQAAIWLLPLALFLLNDVVDYTFDQHPPIPSRGLDVVERVSYALTAASILLGFAVVWLAQRWLGAERGQNRPKRDAA